MISKYDDIISKSRPNSNHPKMNRLQRAAQFAPFAALKGYEDEILETSRIVDDEIILSLDDEDKINKRINYLNDNLDLKIEVSITYFVKDNTKNGGFYQTKKGIIRIIDIVNGKIIFEDKEFILINKIIDIKASCFNEFECY